MPLIMPAKTNREFNPKEFLATIGEGRKVMSFPKKQTIFAQGDIADEVFYIQEGKVRLTVVSKVQGSDSRNIEPGRLFRRGRAGGTTFADGVCERNDGLRTA